MPLQGLVIAQQVLSGLARGVASYARKKTIKETLENAYEGGVEVYEHVKNQPRPESTPPQRYPNRPTVGPAGDVNPTVVTETELAKMIQTDPQFERLIHKHWRPIHDPLDDLDNPRKPETRKAAQELGDYILTQLPRLY